jgi:thiamine-phosphate pyrophosphorylase
MLDYLRLCLVTHFDQTSIADYLQFLLKAVDGGVTSVQLRVKNKTPAEVYEIALILKATLSPLNIPLIINDHIELAKAIDADGIHLGQSDISPAEARRNFGPHKIIGLSIESLEQLEIANTLSDINYVAASAIFQSTTKLDCKTLWGIEGLTTLASRSRHPVIAIGGIQLNNIDAVMTSGASGVAVVSAIHEAMDPQKSAADLMQVIHHSLEEKNHV